MTDERPRIDEHPDWQRFVSVLPTLAGRPEDLHEIIAFAKRLRVHEGRERAALEDARRGRGRAGGAGHVALVG